MKRQRLLLSAFAAAASMLLLSSQAPIQEDAGYAILTADDGSPIPAGAVLYGSRNPEGILTWEAAVGAVEPVPGGRIPVESGPLTRTALALVNVAPNSVPVTWTLRDEAGRVIGQKTDSLGALEHKDLFVEELFPAAANPFLGTLSFGAERGEPSLAAVTLRENLNLHDEAIYSTLPVASIDSTPTVGPVVFAQIGAGGGLSTRLLLVNTDTRKTSGAVSLFDAQGNPLTLDLDGEVGSRFRFEMEADGVHRAELKLDSAEARRGYAVVEADEGVSPPVGVAIFQISTGDRVVTEAGVTARPTTPASRFFVDQADARTGVAVANPNDRAVQLEFALLDLNGNPISTIQRQLARRGHQSLFVDELFQGLPDGFSGLMDLRASDPVVPVALRLRFNRRGDPVLTTMPAADPSTAAAGSRLVFPHLVFGANWSSRLIILNPDTGFAFEGLIRFFGTDGSPLDTRLGDRFGSRFELDVQSGGGADFRPGDNARVVEILLDTFHPDFAEVAVNLGNRLQLRPRVVDGNGNPRSDFKLAFESLDPEVATVDPSGVVAGLERGFSTLTVSAGGERIQGLISVVEVIRGVGAGPTVGIARDLAGRIYMASSEKHVIYRADSIEARPQVYAGVEGAAGLRNGPRNQALFRRPSYLALNQATGDLYVSDSGNSAIRIVRSDGRVVTLTGGGEPGSVDGAGASASFRNPQGIALDGRGRLWVADSANHTIRRIRLASAETETVAGSPGLPGAIDGSGKDARFRNPVGISLANDYASFPRGSPAVLVADAGNGRVRRVSADGSVQTLRRGGFQAAPRGGAESHGGLRRDALQFSQPADLQMDSSGNIFVVEPSARQTTVITANGRRGELVQCGSGLQPRGILISRAGELLMSDEDSSVTLARMAPPAILSVNPPTTDFRNREKITVRGRNFSEVPFIVVGGRLVSIFENSTSRTIEFEGVTFDFNGNQNLTVLARGGLAQAPLGVNPVAFEDLSAGEITTVAGGSSFARDGDFGTVAILDSPTGLTVDAAGNVFFTDSKNSRVRMLEHESGTVTTIAGNGESGFSGDGGPALAAGLNEPEDVDLDSQGNLIIADTLNARIRRLDVDSGVISTVAGDGSAGFDADGGLPKPALEASLNAPRGVAVNPSDDIYIADSFNNRVRLVSAADATIRTVAGNGCDPVGTSCPSDGERATEAAVGQPEGAVPNATGDLIIADRNRHSIRRVDRETEFIETLAGTGSPGYREGSDAQTAPLNAPTAVDVGADGSIYFADTGNNRVRKLSPDGSIATVVGSGCDPAIDNCPAGLGGEKAGVQVDLSKPRGVALAGLTELFVADTGNHRILQVDLTRADNPTVALIGDPCATLPSGCDLGDGGPAVLAVLQEPHAAASDGRRLYVADTLNSRVRAVDLNNGIITTVAGSGSGEFCVKTGLAIEACLDRPQGLALDREGNLLIADSNNHVLRRMNLLTGQVEVLAGEGGRPGFRGDGGPAANSLLSLPTAVAVASDGTIYIADTNNNRVRRIDVTGDIDTVAAPGQLRRPRGLAVDSAENLLIADTLNNRVLLRTKAGVVSVLAGSGSAGYSGDGGEASLADLNQPVGVASAGDFVLISDSFNNRIRIVDRATNTIHTFAGAGGPSVFGDGGAALDAGLARPIGIFVDNASNLYIADSMNHRIRLVRGPVTGPAVTQGSSQTGRAGSESQWRQ